MLAEYDSNPIWGSGKRRRRISGASCESRSKDRRTSAEAASNMKSGTATQKQVSSGIHRQAFDAFALLGCCTMSVGSLSSWAAWTLEDRMDTWSQEMGNEL